MFRVILPGASASVSGLVLAVAAAAPAIAQGTMPAAPACTGAPAPLPPELAGWRDRRAVAAAADAARLEAATLVVGKGADVALRPTPEVTYPVRPEHPGGSVSYGGLLAFSVATPGTYRVVIGSAAWIDIFQGGQPIASTAHSPAPPCSGARKMVDFPLAPGRYVLAIAGNGGENLPVLVTRLP